MLVSHNTVAAYLVTEYKTRHGAGLPNKMLAMMMHFSLLP